MKKLLFLVFAFSLVTAGFGQSVKRQLDQKKIDKFISDMPKIDDALDRLDIDIDDIDDIHDDAIEKNRPLPQLIQEGLREVKMSQDALKILKRFGWDEKFWDIYYAVIISTMVISIEDTFAGTTMPGELKTMLDQNRATVHPDDLALVRKNYEKIDTMIQNL